MGPILFGSLLSLIGIQLVSLGCMYFIGPNMFSSAVYTVYPYIGIGLFSAFQLYDT